MNLLAAVDAASKLFTEISVKDGIFAGLFVATLCFLCWILKRLSDAFMESNKECNVRIAAAVETQAQGSTKITSQLEDLQQGVNITTEEISALRMAASLAMEAAQETDEKQRQFLINQAKKKLG